MLNGLQLKGFSLSNYRDIFQISLVPLANRYLITSNNKSEFLNTVLGRFPYCIQTTPCTHCYMLSFSKTVNFALMEVYFQESQRYDIISLSIATTPMMSRRKNLIGNNNCGQVSNFSASVLWELNPNFNWNCFYLICLLETGVHVQICFHHLIAEIRISHYFVAVYMIVFAIAQHHNSK